MPNVLVLDGLGNQQTIQTLPAVGNTTGAASLPVTIASDQSYPFDCAEQVFAITPSDSTAISTPCPVRVNVAGTVAFRARGSGADVSITALAGELIPAYVQYIRATGTTATGFVGFVS